MFAFAALEVRALEVQPCEPSRQPAAYERIEWNVELDHPYTNPFDPAEIAVDATFAGPDGKTLSLPAFWYQEFHRETANDREQLVADGQPGWRVRFCAPRAGKWQMQVVATDRNGTVKSAVTEFTVAPSKDPGFVRRAPGNWRYLEFDNGQPYFIVGANVCWAGREGLRGYEIYFSRMSEAGANYARLWMSVMPMETRETGLGRYNLRNCWFFDQVFDLAAQHHLRCMLALDTYGSLVTGGVFNEGHWTQNPFNAANGGPLKEPTEFGTNAVARQFYRQRLRYLIGRYAAFTSLGFWEFWNEQDLTRGCVPAGWVAEMSAYFKAHDPYRHLVTTSFSGPGPAAVWNLPDIDLTQRHIYGSDQPMRDMEDQLAKDTHASEVFHKPHLIGEIGISWKGPDTRFDPEGLGTELHNYLWAGALSGGAGGAASWWWDNYINPKNLWFQYSGLARFTAQVDWPRRAFEPIALASPEFANAAGAPATGLKPMALAAGNDEFLVWLLDPASNCTNDLAHKPPRRFTGAVLTLPVAGDAPYQVEWWDTRKAEVSQRGTATPSSGALKLPIPSFERDIALRVVK